MFFVLNIVQEKVRQKNKAAMPIFRQILKRSTDDILYCVLYCILVLTVLYLLLLLFIVICCAREKSNSAVEIDYLLSDMCIMVKEKSFGGSTERE